MPTQPRVVVVVRALARLSKLFASACLASVLVFFLLTLSAFAQTSQLVPLVTDQTPMGLSHDFGVPATRLINQNGDYAFIGEGGSAVFFLSHTAPSGAPPSRVLQYGDEVPGFPGSRIISFVAGLQLNNNGVLALSVNADLATGQQLGIILSYNGTTFQDLVDTTQTAPGGGLFGPASLLGLDDSGDFAFEASANGPIQIFIEMAGKAPVAVAASGQTAPGTGGGTFGGFLNVGTTTGNSLAAPAFNNSGQLLIASNISGAAGGVGIFVMSTVGVREVVANGNANPLGGLFTMSSQTAWAVMNSAGQVAFIAGNPAGAPAGNSLFINSPTSATTGTTAVVAAVGSAAPATLGGTMSFVQQSLTFNEMGWLGLNDNGDIVAVATLSGSSVTGQALLRFVATPANSTSYTTQVVAYSNEAAFGVPGELFSFIEYASINNSGVVSFAPELRNSGSSGPGTIVGGIFQETEAGATSNVILDHQAITGLSGGGGFLLYTEDETGNLFPQLNETVTLNNGTVFFPVDVVGGAADHGEFSWSGGVVRILMNTGQALPSGANVALAQPIGAGDYVAYVARYAGGQANLVVHNIVTQATQTVAFEGEAATGTPAIIKTIGAFYPNSKGHVAFGVSLTGGGTGDGGTFVAIPGMGTGIFKISAAGDTDPATGLTIFGPDIPNSTIGNFSPFNDEDQVAFTAQIVAFDEIMIGAPGVTPVKVVAPGDPVLDGLQLQETTNISLNDEGQLAFVTVPPGTLTVTSTGTTPTPQGIYLATPTGSTPAYSLSQIVATGDPWTGTGGGTFAVFGYPSLNNSAEVTAALTLTGGSSAGGIFVAIGSSGYALALDGTPAPGGGNFSINSATLMPEINDQHDVTFESPSTVGAGIFVRRGSTITGSNPAGVLTEPVLFGEAAPGTAGTFTGGFGTPILGPTGDITISGSYTTGGPAIAGLWHIEANDTLEAMIVQGTIAAEFGGGTLVNSTAGRAWNSGTTAGVGQFPIFGVVSGGTFLDGIFLFEPGIATNTPAGMDVPVSPKDSTTGTTPVSLTFGDVTTAGTTSLTIASGGPTLPTGLELGNPPVYFDISTTAVFAGSVTVCIDTTGINFSGPLDLRLIHFGSGGETDITTSVNGNVVCGVTSSFSPFAVANMLDVTPPVTTASGFPAANGNGWNNTNVMVTLNSTDDLSGVKQITYNATGAQSVASTTVAGASTSVTITAEGTTTVTFFSTDNAGNVETPKTFTVMLDKTAPSISGVAAPTPNAFGWNNTNVTVSFLCFDSLSGLAAGSPPVPTILSSEGTGLSAMGTCTDLAGNSASATVSGIKIDKTPPTSHVLVLPTTESSTSFSVQWAGSDTGSGIQNFTIYVSDNGAAYTPFQSNTSATSATFTGQFGHSYSFYSIAQDLAGNVEGPKTTAEATTTVISPCATDVSGSVSVTRSGFSYSPVLKRYSQTITLKNASGSAITGSISLVLDSLSSNATLLSPSGTTSCVAPVGSPYVSFTGPLNPGASATVTVQFTDPSLTGITYSPDVVAGTGNR